MKKYLIMALLTFSLLFIAACNRNGDTHDTARAQDDTPPTANASTESSLTPESPLEHTIEELGETIVVAGIFWEDWWAFTGLFAVEHIQWFESSERPEYLSEKGHDWGWFSPESGLENDIRNFFLQHYTEAGLNAELTRRFFPIVEYGGVLYICGTRAGFARPNWETATHILIQQEGSRAVVETTVLVGGWHRTDINPMDYAWEEQFRFTLVDGRIDSIDKIELPSSEPIPETTEPRQQESRHVPNYITIRGEQFSTTLTELDLNGMGLTDEEIAPLRYMTNLHILELGSTQFYSNQISNISSLAGLTNLERLILRDNIITDITPLAELTNLTFLDLQGNQISDITPLAGLVNLTFLDLWYNRISDITPLAGLTDLHYLSLDFNQINDWSPVEHIENVGGRPR